MASPGTTVVTGRVRTTGASLDVKKVGFRPRVVILHTTTMSAHWQEGMADASMFKRVADGTGSLAASNGVTPLADGFNIGADADLNPGTPADLYYTAIA